MHFISGLPRSGSTLLAALLRQNPAFTASFQSPIGQVFVTLQEQMSHFTNETACLMDDTQRADILRGLFSSYYGPPVPGHIDVDTNRRWCAHLSLLVKLYPECKVIACVRRPRDIVDSLERLLHAHPMEVSRLISVANTTVYERVPLYLKSTGILGFAFNALRDAYYGPDREHLIMVKYEDLARKPVATMAYLNERLSTPKFEYDFENVLTPPGAKEFDESLGIPGLHAVQRKVNFVAHPTILPPDVAERVPLAFW